LWHLFGIDTRRVTENRKIDFQIFNINKLYLNVLEILLITESIQSHAEPDLTDVRPPLPLLQGKKWKAFLESQFAKIRK